MKAYVFEFSLALLGCGIVFSALVLLVGWVFFMLAQHLSPFGVGVCAGALMTFVCLGFASSSLRS